MNKRDVATSFLQALADALADQEQVKVIVRSGNNENKRKS